MKTNRLLLPFLALSAGIMVFFACNKYRDDAPGPTGLPADETVTASLQGRVLDENGLPVKDAAVTSGTASATTDVNGEFSFSKISMSSRFGFVKVVKQGYFTGSRSVIANAGSSNYVTINLLPRTSKGSFAASGGGTIVVQTGDTVVFDPAAIVIASTNAAYGGTVHVYAAYLDPTDPDLSKHMPGDLRGLGKDGKETALQTFGMMVVELEGDGGEKLQLASGKPATITMTIPDTLRAAAPASIPLWYFNDTTGKWMEQGSAAKKGNTYCGTTSHFSWWNCDAYFPVVSFKVHLIDTHGAPLVKTLLQFVSPTYGVTGGYTDSTGYAQGLIPKGQVVQFQVLNPCGSVQFGENIGPTLADQDLGTLTVDMDTATVTLSGTVVDCANNPVTSGFVNVLVDGLNYRTAVVNGTFTLTVVRCSHSAVQSTMTAVDLGAQQVGQATNVTLSAGSQDMGQLSACGISIDQFVKVSINGTTYNWIVPPDNFTYQKSGSGFGSLYATSGNSGNRFSIYTTSPLTGIGSFDLTDLSMYGPGMRFGAYAGTSNVVQWNISAFGPVNGYITGTLSGNVYDSVGHNSYLITGSLKVLRTQ